MDTHVADLLGAWALDACDDVEATAVEVHLERCAECAAEAGQLREAASWLGVEYAIQPPPGLRQSVLDAARRVRPPSVLHALIGAYAGQVETLDRTLRELGRDDWRRPDPRHGDLAGVMRHLTENDARLAADVNLSVIALSPEAVLPTWRGQADALIEGLGDDTDLERVVSLAGKEGTIPGTLGDALVQRAFETWIHLEDVRRAAAAPPPEQVHRIVSLAVGLLPVAVAAQGISSPGTSLLVLTGEAGGQWTLPFGDFTIRADAVDFARLVANRRRPEQLDITLDGDLQLATRILQIASTLGCD